MKKLLAFLLIGTLLFFPRSTANAAWNSFRNEEGSSGANTIDAQTPVDTQTTGPKWRIQFSKVSGPGLNSTPIITESSIYVVCKNVLYQLDKEGTICSSLTLTTSMNSICHMALDETRLYIPLGSGVMQCVDTRTMTSLWISEAFGQQSLTTVYCHDGMVYAGTTNGTGSDGVFYCLDGDDGHTVWTYKNTETPGGFYWSGSISISAGTDSQSVETLLFGGENGILISHSLTENKVYDTFDLSGLTGSSGRIRAGITYDARTDACYTTTNNGFLYQIKINADGSFGRIQSVFLGKQTDTGATVNCTSTPTICNGRIYVCSSSGTSGQVNVIDADTMKCIYSVTTPDIHDIKSSPLVSTGYATDENHERVYVYFTQNAVPGGIYYIEDNTQAVSAEIKTLYEPKNNPQFCLSSIAADSDGTLYYSNDSGTLFAVAEGYAANDVLPPEISGDSSTNSGNLPTDAAPPALKTESTNLPSAPVPSVARSVKNKKPGKPRKIRYKIRKKKRKKVTVTLSWKKGKNSRKTWIQLGRKRIGLLSGTKKTLTLKKGTYTIKLYGWCPPSQKSAAVKLKLKLK